MHRQGIHKMPQKHNIAFYSFFHGGGIGHYTHELLKRLNDRPELNVQLYCPPNFHWLHEATYPVRPILFQLSSAYPLLRRMRFLMGQFLSPARFLRAARKEKINILHHNNINHFSYPFWQGKFEDSDFHMACTAHDIRRSKAILCHSYETGQLKSFYRDCQLIFVHSKTQAEELKRFANVHDRVICQIPLGPFLFGTGETGPLASTSHLKESTGLFFGNIRDEKNLDGLLEALAISDPNIRLVVAGRPAGAGHRPIEYYKDLANRLNIHHRIQWNIGFIPDEKVRGLFEACDWVALPYLPEFTSQSAVFNVATHFHKPILASSAPTFSELLQAYPIGVLTKDLSTASISSSMDEIAKKSKHPDQFQFESYLRENTWERNAEITTMAYLDLLKNH